MNIIKNIKRAIIEKYFMIRLRLACRKAKKLARKENKKQLVLIFNGKPVVLSMQKIKTLISCHYFAKGITTEYLTKKAVYIAFPKKK